MSASKNLGKVFMTPKGVWNKALNYTKLDIVTNKVGKISCGYIATTDIEKNVEITDNRWLKLFELLDGDLTEEYKAVQTDVTNKATAVDTNKKAVDLIYSQMQKLYDVEISTTTPTNERTGLWINPDDISGVVNIPEIKDDEVSDVDTWSSKKIDNVTNSLKEDIGYARQNINQLSYLQNVGSQKHGYYEESANIWTPNNAITTIEVESNGKTPLYFTGKVLGSVHYGYAILWDAENNIISVIGRSTSTATQYELLEIIPTLQTKKITVSAYTNDGSKISLQKYAVRGIPKVASENFVGHLETAEVDTEYVFIPCYGQSLSNGSDSLYVGDAVIDGNYTIGNIDDPSSGELTSLILSKNGEHPIVSAINSFSTLFKKYIGDAKFVCGSYGTGGQSIAQLMSAKRQAEIKAEENYNYNISSSGRYSIFEEAVNKVAEKCQSVSCPAIIFLQGERDYFSDESLSTQPGSVVAAYACGGDKEKYKSYMLRLKEDMQKKIMQSFNQKEKPLFCIYEVSGAFVKNTAMTINMAQIEFANENDDVVLLPSPYFTPNYNSGHLSTNGYRWYGEYIAKTLFKTVCQHTQNTSMLPIGFRIDTDNSINIKVGNVVNGLTIDTWTVEKASAYGFRVTLDDTETTLTGVSVYGDEIKIYCTDNPRNAKKVEISYAGMEKGGTGNIRDNDGYVSMYTYWDDTSDTGSSGKLTVTHRPTDINGNNIVGKKYPMQNWLQNFYYKIKG